MISELKMRAHMEPASRRQKGRLLQLKETGTCDKTHASSNQLVS